MKRNTSVFVSLCTMFMLIWLVGAGQAHEPQHLPGGHPSPVSLNTSVSTPLGDGITFQGKLNEAGDPANGPFDFQFTLYDAASGGSQVGDTLTLNDVPVINGLFTVQLDFGDATFQGEACWLEVAVRPGASTARYTVLNPRQEITAVPYALSLQPGAVVNGADGVIVLSLSGGTVGLDSSGSLYGVYGHSNNEIGRGVVGLASAINGGNIGVYGQSNSGSGYGVYGWASAGSGDGIGVYGESASAGGTGVYGYASASDGTTYGMYGQSDSPIGAGVKGYATSTSSLNVGVVGSSPNGTGVLGSSSSGDAGLFFGRVYVLGELLVTGSKSFKIDHPLDPVNRYLYHFSQEGPEVQNVYNGVVSLDAEGGAVVSLPEYFSALNTEPYRYQLTPIGAPMPNLYVAEEIQENSFTIAGGVPYQKVSWEVTAVRNDPYIRDHPVVAEQEKPEGERGTYIYPEGYGQPAEKRLDYLRYASLLKQIPDVNLPGSIESK